MSQYTTPHTHRHTQQRTATTTTTTTTHGERQRKTEKKSQKQVESGSSVNEEMVTHIQIKKREWKDKVERALWGSALWTLTKAMKSAIDSWSARAVSTILGIKRGAEEAMDQWWRRFHRVGHEILKKRNQSLSNMAERLIHRWAGHVARLPTNHLLAEVVRVRAVQCWRWAQQRHTDKWTGVHPKRFKIFR